jgi:osmotically-inducible protein OsmY
VPDARLLGLLLLLAALGACGPSAPARRMADDQDITRDILWELRKDPRMAAVRVTCVERVVTLEGTVADRPALDDAVRVATRNAGLGARVVSSLVIRPR